LVNQARLAGLAPPLQPILFSHDGRSGAQGVCDEVKRTLDAASPSLAGDGWTVIQSARGGRLHAKCLLARFGRDRFGSQPFLRLYVGSANFSQDRGRAQGSWKE
jgi:hypothetical protein